MAEPKSDLKAPTEPTPPKQEPKPKTSVRTIPKYVLTDRAYIEEYGY